MLGIVQSISFGARIHFPVCEIKHDANQMKCISSDLETLGPSPPTSSFKLAALACNVWYLRPTIISIYPKTGPMPRRHVKDLNTAYLVAVWPKPKMPDRLPGVLGSP